MSQEAVTPKYAITVDMPSTGKPTVEVAGLGVFPNHETTELTDEQVTNWFNRPGADPTAQFPQGITITEIEQEAVPEESVPTEEAAPEEPESVTETTKPKTASRKKKDEVSPPAAEETAVETQDEAPAEKSVPESKKGDA